MHFHNLKILQKALFHEDLNLKVLPCLASSAYPYLFLPLDKILSTLVI